MRLAEFILENVEPILVEWERFARSIWPAVLNDPENDPTTLRDHAEELLRSSAADIVSDQTALQQSNKSTGEGEPSASSERVDRASERHAVDRVSSGFELWAVVAEYRALRASVIRLWRDSGPSPDLRDLNDLTRFNESMDQSLTEAVRSFTEVVLRDREASFHREQAARKDSEAANRAKDLFLATLSHEMRTPLSAIVGWLTLLRLEDISEANLAEGLEVIERNTMAQVKLIDDVLDVSRIVSGKLRLEIHECDLTKAILAGIDAVRPAAHAKNITLVVQLDPAASRVSCDALRIQQVVWNLLSNAIKFGRKRGTVRVLLEQEQSSWRISVSDDGMGIESDLLPNVFDPFRQAQHGTRRRFGGLGLGLSLVKHLTEMHGGTVEALSDGQGLGATFIVRLPIRAVRDDENKRGANSAARDGVEQEAAAHPDSPMMRLDGLHVLVVDDEADARRLLERALEGVGASVTTAGSAADALAALASARSQPNILVSDVGMPDQDGYDLVRELRRRGYHADRLPAVALTAFAHEDDARLALAAGFQTHIPKPVSLRDLAAAVANLARRTG